MAKSESDQATARLQDNAVTDEVIRLLRKGWATDEIVDQIQRQNPDKLYTRTYIVDVIEHIASQQVL